MVSLVWFASTNLNDEKTLQIENWGWYSFADNVTVLSIEILVTPS